MATPLTSAQLIDRCEEILEDSSNAVFTAASISSQLQDDLKKVSYYSPWMVRQSLFARDGSRELDISTIDNLRYVDVVEYPVDKDERYFRNFSEYHNTLRMDIGAKPSAGTQDRDVLLTTGTEKQTLTGTVTFTANSTAVTGSGTAFTSELQVGYYISPTSLTAWYRVAIITDDTNLILAEVVKTNDDGADTADSTYYWFRPVYLYCAKNHYVEKTITDFAGAIDNASGYAKGQWMVHIDNLATTGTMPKDMLFTIAGVDGVYRVTADVTLASSEGDFFIDPPLSGVAANAAVVTFYGSSLTKELEVLLPEYVAAKVAINWTGDSRTQWDLAAVDIGTDANGEMDLVNPETDLAKAHTASGIAITNVVPVDSNAQENFFQGANTSGGVGSGYLSTAAGWLRQASSRFTAINFQLALHNLGLERLSIVTNKLEELVVPRYYQEHPRD